jgi:hypothetical protein
MAAMWITEWRLYLAGIPKGAYICIPLHQRSAVLRKDNARHRKNRKISEGFFGGSDIAPTFALPTHRGAAEKAESSLKDWRAVALAAGSTGGEVR